MAIDQVQDVKERIDIVSLVGTYVPLQKKGRHYQALCPFHEEKTPSFIVSPELQLFKCFGCGKAGDVFTFLQEIEGMSFAEALQVLAEQASVTLIKRTKTPQEQKQAVLIKLNELAADVFHHLLKSHASGERARSYLEHRGLTPETIDRFKLGYAPERWDFLSEYLRKKGFSEREVTAAGLCVLKKEGGVYDRFRGRLMFPLVDTRGEIVGFSARALDKNQEPKYLNSPESLIFSKSKFLYGYHSARGEIKKTNCAVLVEGVMDVITPSQAGLTNFVAPLGTALTSSQLNLLSKLTSKLVFCFDSDNAGLEATKRGICLAQERNFDVLVVILQGSKDPDEALRLAPEKFKQQLEEALPVMDYYFHTAINQYNPASAQGKKRISEYLLPAIKSLASPVERSHYLRRLSEVLDVGEEVLVKSLESASTLPVSEVVTERAEATTSLEEYIIALLLKAPLEMAQSASYRLGKNDFSEGVSRQVFVALKERLAGRSYKLNIKSFIASLDEEAANLVSKCYLLDLGQLEADADKLQTEMNQSLQLVKNRSIKRELQKLSVQIKSAEAVGDTAKSEKLQQQFLEYTQRLD